MRNRPFFPVSLFIPAILMLALSGHMSADNWPSWRGPDQNGVSSEVNLPARWSPSQHIQWRLDLPGPAPSTPVIWDDRIFLTSAEGGDLHLLCVDRSGDLLWKHHLGGGNQDIRQGESNAAAPSPCTDGQYVWVFTGTGVLACFDFAGNMVWKTDVEERYGTFNMYWGMATSPMLHKGRLYLQLMHTDAQLVLALDPGSGEEIWQHRRATDARVECLHSYATPVIYHDGARDLLLTHGADYIVAHDLSDGSEVWRCGGLQGSVYNEYLRFVATPAVSEGLIVVPSAKNGPILGLKPAGAGGDITGVERYYQWNWENNTTDVPSPLIHDGLVYICRENGTLICIDAETGEEVYKSSVYRTRHRGSPVYADGKIYLVAMDGTISVIRAGRTYELIAQNEMNERMSASIAVSGGTLFLRTYEALYAVKSP